MAWQPLASLRVIRERARLYRQIRAFFNVRGCLEVDTPLLLPATNTDANIHSLEVPLQQTRCFLQTSPEFAMKRLLAAGSDSIYQICHAFRDGEKGDRHNPEFSLLEWYRIGFDYQKLMDEIELLITSLDYRDCSFKRITYHQLFHHHLQIDIDHVSLLELRRICNSRVAGAQTLDLDFDQCLDLLLGMVITPAMKGYQFVFDYPISQAALARAKKDNANLAERFELFHDGLELANGFSELTDAAQQYARFEQDNATRKARGLPQYPFDEKFLAALEAGLPECAGVAIGLDRLLMVLLKLDSIEQVLSFTE
jgi:lysyl-tRNA synthetase class 2